MVVDPGGNKFNVSVNKGTGCVFIVGTGVASDIRHKLNKISGFQSLADSLSDPDTINEKINNLLIQKDRTKSIKKKDEIVSNIDYLKEVQIKFADELLHVAKLKLKEKEALREIFEKVGPIKF